MCKRWLSVLVVMAACDANPKSTPASTKPRPPDELATRAVRVDQGWFASGCVELPRSATREDAISCAGSNAPRRLWISTFEIEAIEVTTQAYANCVAANACTASRNAHSQGTPMMPAVVRFEQASQYCSWQGKRLPTEAEWEKAARGTDGRMYPWGNEPPTCDTAALVWDPLDQNRRLLCKRRVLSVVATHPQDRSPYGAMDMAGNAPEWTSDLLLLDRGEWRDFQAPGTVRFIDPVVVNPQGPSADVVAAAPDYLRGSKLFAEHVMRGGLKDAAIGTRSQVPMDWDDDDKPVAGFRCARSLASGPPPTAPEVVEAKVEVIVTPGAGVQIRSSAL